MLYRTLSRLHVSIAFGLSAATFNLLPTALAQTIESANCPLSWMGAIEKVAEARSTPPINSDGVIFSGLDGQLYNCLDEKVPAEEMQQLQQSQGPLALALAEQRAKDPDRELGYCDCGHATNPSGFKIYICNLPYERTEVTDERCAKRLDSYLESLR